MSSNQTSPLRRAWLRWKSIRLPWRSRFLVGLDLEGNTFWEFKDTLSSKQGRMRRIVQYPSTVHHSDVTSKISPAWHQWLRHTRDSPPSLTEQSQDLVRQRNLKVLVAQADARWAAKPSFLDVPGKGRNLLQSQPALGVKDPGGYSKSEMATEPEHKQGVRSGVGSGLNESLAEPQAQLGETVESNEVTQDVVAKAQEEKMIEEERKSATMAEQKHKEDPWKKAKGGPSEGWQPQAWTGESARR